MKVDKKYYDALCKMPREQFEAYHNDVINGRVKVTKGEEMAIIKRWHELNSEILG